MAINVIDLVWGNFSVQPCIFCQIYIWLDRDDSCIQFSAIYLGLGREKLQNENSFILVAQSALKCVSLLRSFVVTYFSTPNNSHYNNKITSTVDDQVTMTTVVMPIAYTMKTTTFLENR